MELPPYMVAIILTLQILMEVLAELIVILFNKVFKPLLVQVLMRLPVFLYPVLELTYIAL